MFAIRCLNINQVAVDHILGFLRCLDLPSKFSCYTWCTVSRLSAAFQIGFDYEKLLNEYTVFVILFFVYTKGLAMRRQWSGASFLTKSMLLVITSQQHEACFDFKRAIQGIGQGSFVCLFFFSLKVITQRGSQRRVFTGRLWSSTSGHQYKVYRFVHFKKVY